MMKKIILFALSLALLTSCYEDYVVDYEYSATYFAYQYDLRTFIPGEITELDLGVVLAGVMDNKENRTVNYNLDDELVTGDLSRFSGGTPFTAMDGMKGSAPVGTLSQQYVSDAIKASQIAALTPLPKEMYTLSDTKMVIPKGSHTSSLIFKADAGLLEDENMGINPYYAFGLEITDADVDSIIVAKSFSIIALRCENTFFGYWYHGGKSTTKDASGNVVSEDVYPTRIPADVNTYELYTLTSASRNSVNVNFMHNTKGATMTITQNGDGIELSSADGSLEDKGSSWNHAKLLQDRKLFLNYEYTDASGNRTTVTDTLTFRNRIRDGINEWQDEVQEHYK